MTHVRLKLLGATAAIAVGVAFLAVAGIREGWVYYLPVDQFLAGESYQGQRVRLHGTVSSENLQLGSAGTSARFELLGETTALTVQYEGVVPDMFKAGREVVVEGRLADSGVFAADTLLTKCASKYETAEGEAPRAAPRPAETGG